MRTLKLTLEYDGTEFVGWQRQRRGRSVQGAVEEACARLTQVPTRVVAAGRTDAGVHALGQVAHLRTTSPLPPDRVRDGLNALLPRDVTVRAVEEAPERFHARYDARYRVYRYAVLRRAAPSALLRRYALHLPEPLDLDRMRAVARVLEGRHDFRAFAAVGTPRRSTVCTVLHVGLAEDGDLLRLTVAADRFLRHMVRMLVGTLLRVGRGTLGPDQVQAWLTHGEVGAAGPAAPPHGLYLVHVGYDAPTG